MPQRQYDSLRPLARPRMDTGALIPLLKTTGSAQVDAILANVVSAYESHFPERVSYYLIGSHADGSAVPLSDIDLILVFGKQFHDPAEERAAQQIARELTRAASVRLDITPRGEDAVASMYAVIQVGLAQNSVLLYGPDLRFKMSLPSFEAYIADVIRGALFFIARLHGVEHIKTLPLTYPNPGDRYFGYARKVLGEWYPPDIHAGTKELVATVSRIATATAAIKTVKYIGSKQQGIQLFGDAVGGPWASFARAVYSRCKLEWNYLIPAALRKQNELADLCGQMLTFENEFCRQVPISEIQ